MNQSGFFTCYVYLCFTRYVYLCFYKPIAYERVFIHERFQPWLSDWENFAVFDRWSLIGGI